METTQARQIYDYNITKLMPGADYNIKLFVIYKSGSNFTWPSDYNKTVSLQKITFERRKDPCMVYKIKDINQNFVLTELKCILDDVFAYSDFLTLTGY